MLIRCQGRQTWVFLFIAQALSGGDLYETNATTCPEVTSVQVVQVVAGEPQANALFLTAFPRRHRTHLTP